MHASVHPIIRRRMCKRNEARREHEAWPPFTLQTRQRLTAAALAPDFALETLSCIGNELMSK